MYFNKVSALIGAIAVIEQASALSLHRHEHKLEKKQDVVEVYTVVTTIYVEEGAIPEPTAPVGANNANNVPQNFVTVPSTPPKIIAPELKAAAPAPAHTTLATHAKPAPTSGSGPGSHGGAPFSGKRGLAYNDAKLANFFGSQAKSGAFGWSYNWDATPFGIDSRYSFIPMLWGNKGDKFQKWGTSCGMANGAKAVFSFNEPDNAGQAAMDPATAAAHHVKYMNPCSGKALVGAPAVTNSDKPAEGLRWLTSFVDTCKSKGCKYDFCNVHWYSPANQMDSLFTHLEQAHKICGDKPIFLTEFAPLGSPAEIDAFMTKAVPKLDALSYLHGYSYFMVRQNSLLSSGNSLSSVGKIFASL
ncbi:Glycoside hydrolase, superfamily [Metarhizium rileyi]|uniref:Glycoside hydrolase, superfamily n=1 Tax=Metarhizium rileyi (strain RCEF 4871) TaxID=1649241 RepID=A0A162LSE1_METRR|nr:Glycoside hydrolase, superfamily [Metarhizium rileyi RCEF 4871]TWU78716.1 hypothetical protein ED733_006308 [Metarhizium rileyi]